MASALTCTKHSHARRKNSGGGVELQIVQNEARHSVEGSLKTVAAVTGGDSTWGFWMKVTIAAVAA
jgi:hypothetical protein